MRLSIEDIQAALAHLPDHILEVDLLVFRRRELEKPTPWLELAGYAIILLEGVRALRADRLDSEAASWRRAPVCAAWDPPLLEMGGLRLDTIPPTALLAAQGWAAREATTGRPSCRDPAREQLASLVEERLHDLLLEVEHGIRRQRRAPKRPPERNPLHPGLPWARRALMAETAQLFEAVARQIGPIPDDRPRLGKEPSRP